MSPTPADNALRKIRDSAPLFAALGDPTRLKLLAKLGSETLSISQLARGSPVTRQAITKHLCVLQKAGLVCGIRRGRQQIFHLQPNRIDAAHTALDQISRQWDQALARLKTFVEK